MKPRPILLSLLIAGALATTGVVVAGADNLHFVAPLKSGEEVQEPSVISNAAGVSTMSVSRDGAALNYRLNVANIDDVLFSHIHCGAVGVNGPVVAFLYPGPTVSPNGVLATGTVTEADVIDRPDSAACPGGVSGLDDLLDKIESGDAYVNVHTVAYQAGEIRGQIK
jgi:hypothetical protein